MANHIKRVALIGLIGFGLFQISACDQLNRIKDTCSTQSENGNTSINCSPNQGGSGDGDDE